MVIETEQTITEVKPSWQLAWLVDVGYGCQCGITTDDHCYVVLSKNLDGQWKPYYHIPISAAKRLGELVNHGMADSIC